MGEGSGGVRGRAPGGAEAPPGSRRRVLAVEVDQVLQHLVGGGDHARVGLEAALRADHVRELLGEVHVRHLDLAGGHQRVVAPRGPDALGTGAARRGPAVARDALQAGLVGELRQREVSRGHARAARGGVVGDRAVLADRQVRRAGGDLDELVRAAPARGRATEHVLAVLGDEVALLVAGEVARAGVLDVRDRGRAGGRVGARDAEPAPVALERDVERVAGRLQRARRHVVVDRAELHAEADLDGVRAALRGVRGGGAALQLRERLLEGRALALVAERVDVRDVVGRDVQHRLVDLQAADRGIHAAHHGCICSLETAASSRRSGRWWVVAVAPLGDDGAVDVGEDLLLHVVAVDRGDDRPVGDGDDERRRVDEDDRRARALAGGAVEALVQAAERGRAHVDPAPLDTLQRVRRELDRRRLLRLAEDVGERGADGHLRGARRARRPADRREAGRDQRGVVLDRAHRTDVIDVGSTPVWPATLSVAAPVLSRFMPSTVPETAVPSVPVYVTVWPRSPMFCVRLILLASSCVAVARFVICSSDENCAIWAMLSLSSAGFIGSWFFIWATISFRKSSLPRTGSAFLVDDVAAVAVVAVVVPVMGSVAMVRFLACGQARTSTSAPLASSIVRSTIGVSVSEPAMS